MKGLQFKQIALGDGNFAYHKIGVGKPGRLKRIHVNQHVIRANKKNGTHEPPLSIIVGRTVHRCHRVEIAGASEAIYSPDKPLSCGARVWIETRAMVFMHGHPHGESMVP